MRELQGTTTYLQRDAPTTCFWVNSKMLLVVLVFSLVYVSSVFAKATETPQCHDGFKKAAAKTFKDIKKQCDQLADPKGHMQRRQTVINKNYNECTESNSAAPPKSLAALKKFCQQAESMMKKGTKDVCDVYEDGKNKVLKLAPKKGENVSQRGAVKKTVDQSSAAAKAQQESLTALLKMRKLLGKFKRKGKYFQEFRQALRNDQEKIAKSYSSIRRKYYKMRRSRSASAADKRKMLEQLRACKKILPTKGNPYALSTYEWKLNQVRRDLNQFTDGKTRIKGGRSGIADAERDAKRNKAVYEAAVEDLEQRKDAFKQYENEMLGKTKPGGDRGEKTEASGASTKRSVPQPSQAPPREAVASADTNDSNSGIETETDKRLAAEQKKQLTQAMDVEQQVQQQEKLNAQAKSEAALWKENETYAREQEQARAEAKLWQENEKYASEQEQKRQLDQFSEVEREAERNFRMAGDDDGPPPESKPTSPTLNQKPDEINPGVTAGDDADALAGLPAMGTDKQAKENATQGLIVDSNGKVVKSDDSWDVQRALAGGNETLQKVNKPTWLWSSGEPDPKTEVKNPNQQAIVNDFYDKGYHLNENNFSQLQTGVEQQAQLHCQGPCKPSLVQLYVGVHGEHAAAVKVADNSYQVYKPAKGSDGQTYYIYDRTIEFAGHKMPYSQGSWMVPNMDRAGSAYQLYGSSQEVPETAPASNLTPLEQ